MPKLVLKSQQFAWIYMAAQKELSILEAKLAKKLGDVLGDQNIYSSYFTEKTEEACEKLSKSIELLNAKIKIIELEHEEPSDEILNTLSKLKDERSKAESLKQELQELYDTFKDFERVCILLKEKSEERNGIFEGYSETIEEHKEFKRKLGSGFDDTYLLQ